MLSDDYTALQNEVFFKAKCKLEVYDWYQGVCTDYFRQNGGMVDDDYIKEHGVDHCVEMLVDDTAFWDAPSSYYMK